MMGQLEFHACDVSAEGDENEIVVPNTQKDYRSEKLTLHYNTLENHGSSVSVHSTVENKWFRVIVRMSDIDDNLNGDYDTQFKNEYEDLNNKVMIFNENKLAHIIYVPNFAHLRGSWDVGLLNVSKQKFVKINV